MNPFAVTRRMLLPDHGHLDLDGKVVLVTGGADGIGLATTRLLRDRGAAVVVVDRNSAAAAKAATELGQQHSLAVAADVTDRVAMRQAVTSAVEHFGHLDVVIANAGITPPPATLRTLDPAEFDKVIDVNLTGVLNTVQPAIEQLIANQGHVVVVASAAAFSPPVGGSAYMISKAAVEVLARAFKLELAPHGVSVTTSYFGVVETQLARTTLDEDPMGEELNALLPAPLRRRITADEAARAIVTAIERRSASSTAPFAWAPLGVLRGVLGPVLDRYLVGDPGTHAILQRLEARSGTPSRTVML